MMKKSNSKVGTFNQTKKNISNPMVKAIIRYQKHLQLQENIRFGRKARSISFVFATSKPKELAKFILGDNK